MTSNIIVFYRDVLASPAFRSLSRTAMLVYLDFLGKRRMCKIGRHKTLTILNNGEITYYYSEAENKGISRMRFRNAIDELIEKGFIDLVHQGKGYHKGTGYQRDKSLYALSERWRDYGTPNFLRKTRPKDTREGLGFKKIWNQKKAKVGIENDTCTGIENDTCVLKVIKTVKNTQRAST